jgi:hypothetical protein
LKAVTPAELIEQLRQHENTDDWQRLLANSLASFSDAEEFLDQLKAEIERS